MHEKKAPTAQWTLDCSVFHVDGYRHVVLARVLGRRGGWVSVGSWSWTGLGVPEPLVNDLQARIAAVVAEHLVTRYGVEGELPLRWAGEVGEP
jgi:hypothetical protein